jgi:hypothetical protein
MGRQERLGVLQQLKQKKRSTFMFDPEMAFSELVAG